MSSPVLEQLPPEENCPPTLKLTLSLTQTPTLTGGQFLSEAIVRISSSPCYIVILIK